MPVRLVRNRNNPRRQQEAEQKQQQSRRPPTPRQSPRKSAASNGNDTSGTHSPDSSFENKDGSPVQAAQRRPQQGAGHSKQVDASSIHAGEKDSVILHDRTSSSKQHQNQNRHSVQHQQRSAATGRSKQELDDILLMDTMALAEKTGKQFRNQINGSSRSGSKSQESSTDGSSSHLWKAQEQPDVVTNNLTLGSSAALAGSAVGLSLLTASPPEDEWTNPPAIMVRESLARHMQLCIAQQQQDPNHDYSLPVDDDAVSFPRRTNSEQVSQVALQYIAEGEHDKALEIYRVLLREQQRQQKHHGNNNYNESDIANTKSKLATLCLLMGRTQAAIKFATDAVRIHQKSASRPVHTTLSTMELGLAQLGAQELDKALMLWRESLQLACMTLGYDHFQVSVLLNNIGCLHYYMGNLSSSVRALEESLGLQRQMLSSTSREGDQEGKVSSGVEIPLIQIATTMGNLAMLSAECRTFDVAVNLLEEATAIQESVLEENDNADYSVAQQYLERFSTLAAQQTHGAADEHAINNNNHCDNRVSGDSTNSSSASNSILHPTFSIFGDSDGIPLRRGATGSKRNKSSPDDEDHNLDFILLGSLVKPVSPRQRVHYTIVSSLEAVVHNQNAQDMLDDASVTSSLFTRKKRSIPVDLDGEIVINAELHLEEINLQALDHLYRNEIRDALDLFESALRSHREKYGDIHHLVGTGLHNCGIVHMVAQHYAQAKMCFQEAVSVRTAALGDSHPDVAASMLKLGMIHMASGDLEGAETVFKSIVGQLQKSRGTNGYSSEAKMLNNLGVVQYEMGRDKDAMESLLRAFEIQKSIYKQTQCPWSERLAAKMLGNLGFIYAKQSNYDDALTIFKETLDIMKKHVPGDHPLVITLDENIAMVKAYGAEDSEERRKHGQSNPFACVQTNDIRDHQRTRQSKVTACVGLR